MSRSAVTCIDATSISTTRTCGKGRGPRLFAVHASPIEPFASQAPVMRESQRESQFVPSGPGAEYLRAFQTKTFTSCTDGPGADSGQEKMRTCLVPLWLAKYIVSRAPRTHR